MRTPAKQTTIQAHKARVADEMTRAANMIRSASSFVVCAHMGPDGDAIGSTLGLTQILREQGKTVVAFNHDPVPYNFAFMVGSDSLVADPDQIDFVPEVLVILDCSSLDRVHPELTFDKDATQVLIVDHHATYDAAVADVFVHDTRAASVGEMLVQLAEVMEHELSQESATCLYTSIQTDTGSFRYSNTSPETLSAAAKTVAAGVDVWEVSSSVYENHPVARVRLLAEVLSTLELSSCGRLAFLTVTDDMYVRTESGPDMLDGFINHARGIRGVEVAAQLRQTGEDEWKISLRSRGAVDVAKVAEGLGGGGHHNAAGCRATGTPEVIRNRLSASLTSLLDN